MFEKFNQLLTALNDECCKRSDEDLSLLENSMTSVLDAWTDYMMSCEEAPTDAELNMYHSWFELVERF